MTGEMPETMKVFDVVNCLMLTLETGGGLICVKQRKWLLENGGFNPEVDVLFCLMLSYKT